MGLGGTEHMDRAHVEAPGAEPGIDRMVREARAVQLENGPSPMASIPSGKPLTGEPDARNLPVRFGGRGSGRPLSLPLFCSRTPAIIFFFVFQRRDGRP